MEFTHHPDFTCLAQAHVFSAGHHQIERYTFFFRAGKGESLKSAVKRGIVAAIESRERRGITSGRLHVEMADDVCGRVVDHLPVDERGDVRKVEPPEGDVQDEHVELDEPGED